MLAGVSDYSAHRLLVIIERSEPEVDPRVVSAVPCMKRKSEFAPSQFRKRGGTVLLNYMRFLESKNQPGRTLEFPLTVARLYRCAILLDAQAVDAMNQFKIASHAY